MWCEYLPPWVLRKEFHTILAAYGVQYLCSDRFRQGLGPAEDATDPAGGGWAVAVVVVVVVVGGVVVVVVVFLLVR